MEAPCFPTALMSEFCAVIIIISIPRADCTLKSVRFVPKSKDVITRLVLSFQITHYSVVRQRFSVQFCFIRNFHSFLNFRSRNNRLLLWMHGLDYASFFYFKCCALFLIEWACGLWSALWSNQGTLTGKATCVRLCVAVTGMAYWCNLLDRVFDLHGTQTTDNDDNKNTRQNETASKQTISYSYMRVIV